VAAFLPLPVIAAGGERLTQRFRSADADGNGMLSRAEAQRALPRLARHFDAIDVDGDGQISPEEVRAFRRSDRASARTRANPKSKLEAYFERADSDGNGVLTLAEAERGLPRIAAKFARIDRNRDGGVTLEELRAWLALRKSARGG